MNPIRPNHAVDCTWMQGHLVGVSRAKIEEVLGFAPQREGDDRYGPEWRATYGTTPFSIWDRGGSGLTGTWTVWGHLNTLRHLFGDEAVKAFE